MQMVNVIFLPADIVRTTVLHPFLSTWINFNSSMDM